MSGDAGVTTRATADWALRLACQELLRRLHGPTLTEAERMLAALVRRQRGAAKTGRTEP